VKKETGALPKAALLTHVDGSYGNVVDAAKVGKICREYGVPFLLNTAYSSGRMPVDGKKLNADFITCSGHKSWAAGGGNVGILAVTEEYKRVLAPSGKYASKPLEILGCSSRGSATVALMASFPHVKERIKRWDEEVERARWLASELEKTGVNQLGEAPKNHDLAFYTSDALYKISETHKKKRFFLYEELKERGIVGIKAGLTKQFKLSTYGKTRAQVEHIAGAFKEIIANHLNV